MAWGVDVATKSSALSGSSTGGNSDSSGFVVNYGAGSSVGTAGGLPTWALIALAVGAVWLLRKRG